MTNKQWQQKKRRERQKLREVKKERELNRRIERNSLLRMFINDIEKVECECEAEKMRTGIFCETCRLIPKIRQYALDLFKDAAEGRSSYI